MKASQIGQPPLEGRPSIASTPRSNKLITPRASIQGRKPSSTDPTPAGSPKMSPAVSKDNLDKIKKVSEIPRPKQTASSNTSEVASSSVPQTAERKGSESESVKEMAKKISEKGSLPQTDFSDDINKPDEADVEYLRMQVKDLTEKLNILNLCTGIQ
uniref:Uncharacterized protein n=1 Tax=Panagrolaimus sp. ES5 TaxID=591445 RepID=A0AC34FEA3_9BILA